MFLTETTDVDEAVESESMIESKVGLTNIPLHATAKALVKESSDADLDIANEEETTDDDLAKEVVKANASPMPKGDTEEDENDYAETMKPKHAVTKSRIGEETPMPKGKAMSPVVPRAVGGTEMPQPEAKDDGDDDDDEESKKSKKATLLPLEALESATEK